MPPKQAPQIGGSRQPASSTWSSAKPSQVNEPSYRAILQREPYMIKTFIWKAEGAVQGESLLSQTLKKKVTSLTDAGLLTLSDLRKLVPGMSRLQRLHKFCTASGTPVTDESITFAQYLAIEPPVEEEDETPDEATQPEESEETEQEPAKATADATKPEVGSGKTAADAQDPSAGPKVLSDDNKSTPADPKGSSTDANEDSTTSKSLSTDTKEDPAKTKGSSVVPKGKAPTRKVVSQARSKVVPIPSVDIYYRSSLSDVVAPPDAGAGAKPDINLTLSDKQDTVKATTTKLDALVSADKDAGPRASSDKLLSAGQLTEDQWSTVLRNCGVFYGWIVDPRTRIIKRAPRAAFQLRTKDYVVPNEDGSLPVTQPATGSTTGSASLPQAPGTTTTPVDATGIASAASATNPSSETAASTQAVAAQNDATTSAGTGSSSTGASTAISAPAPAPIAAPVSGSTQAASTTTVSDQAPANAPVSSGTQPSPAIAAPAQASIAVPVSSGTQASSAITPPAQTPANAPVSGGAQAFPSASQRLKEITDAADRKQREADEQATNSKPATAVQPPKPQVVVVDKVLKRIPNFRVNDDSKIDITVCTHDLMQSFAQNDFSSQSTEASVSGGFGGITAGVSAGFAKSSSSDSSTTNTQQQSTMVGRYKFPRCDLFLYANDLEPTPELQSLLNEVQVTKNINVLRRFHREFGQLFCQEVTLGGRLLSTKIMTSTSKEDKASKKEQFKVSVGVSVNTPWGGGSVKHEQEKGSGSSTATSEQNTAENNVFEAVGGDTILSKDPPTWSTTVADPNLWRVIERDGLSSLIEMLAQMPGYAKVQSWFAQAVPALSKFITLDSGHEVITRLKITSPTNSLGLSPPAHYYLGHSMDKVVTPRMNYVRSGENFWLRVDMTESKVLFSPSTYRAPTIQGFSNYNVGNTQYGASYNKDFAAVEWSIVAPFSEELTHGTRIIMKTVPFVDPNKQVNPGDVDSTPPAAQMVVFRNAQGLFVPAMSDRDEFQYWRILKDGGALGEHIKSGDQVRLCWSFNDQTTGYRDYVDDIFGRRQTTAPEGSPDVLYLKVPWPRFEKNGDPVAMVMSQHSEGSNVLQNLVTSQGSLTYVMQDLKFRIDTVENNGRGDSDDYLLRNVSQGRDITSITIGPGGVPFQIDDASARALRNNIFFFGIAKVS